MKQPGRLLLLYCALVFVLVCRPLQASADSIIYQQAPDFQNLWASQNDIGHYGAFATVYDNFRLSTSAGIGSISWIGGYFNGSNVGPITSWTITFWSDSAGQPGSQLMSFSIAGNANETFLQSDSLGDPIFSYNAAVHFYAKAGETYWLSVVPDLSFPSQWGWTTSSQGDGVSYQDFFGARYLDTNDQAFTLSSTVPEPYSLTLLALGITAVTTRLRRQCKTFHC